MKQGKVSNGYVSGQPLMCIWLSPELTHRGQLKQSRPLTPVVGIQADRRGGGDGDLPEALTKAISPRTSSQRTVQGATSRGAQQQQVAALSKAWLPAGQTGTHASLQEVLHVEGTLTFHKFIVTSIVCL